MKYLYVYNTHIFLCHRNKYEIYNSLVTFQAYLYGINNYANTIDVGM